jgi:hypothetical protein
VLSVAVPKKISGSYKCVGDVPHVLAALRKAAGAHSTHSGFETECSRHGRNMHMISRYVKDND